MATTKPDPKRGYLWQVHRLAETPVKEVGIKTYVSGPCNTFDDWLGVVGGGLHIGWPGSSTCNTFDDLVGVVGCTGEICFGHLNSACNTFDDWLGVVGMTEARQTLFQFYVCNTFDDLVGVVGSTLSPPLERRHSKMLWV